LAAAIRFPPEPESKRHGTRAAAQPAGKACGHPPTAGRRADHAAPCLRLPAALAPGRDPHRVGHREIAIMGILASLGAAQLDQRNMQTQRIREARQADLVALTLA